MEFLSKLFNIQSQSSVVNKIGFDDVREIVKSDKYILINTLPSSEQQCLIRGTISCSDEENIINSHLNKNLGIVIYGKNSNENKVYEKYGQLIDLGFTKIYIYVGGLFEWLLLHDIYGEDEFPTTSKELDILKFRPKSVLRNNYLLTDMD